MTLVWVQALGVVVTLVAALAAAWNARSANNSQTEVQHRTVSLDEMEKALTFTGEQLRDLRAQTTLLQEEVHRLQIAHDECQRDNRSLRWEMERLKRGQR